MLDSFPRVSLFPSRRETVYCPPLLCCEHYAGMVEGDNVEFKENGEVLLSLSRSGARMGLLSST